MSTLPALEAVPGLAAANERAGRPTSGTPPRKVIVGTVMQSFWGEYPGLRQRMEQLAELVEHMTWSLPKAGTNRHAGAPS